MSLKYNEPRILQSAIDDKGRPCLVLYRGDGTKANCRVHQLIALTFLGPCPPGLEVCHNDGNPANNHIGNLRYDTQSENELDKVRHGTHPEANRTHCDSGHEFTEQNSMWRYGKGGKANGKKYRKCKACHARYVRECRWRKEGKLPPIADCS